MHILLRLDMATWRKMSRHKGDETKRDNNGLFWGVLFRREKESAEKKQGYNPAYKSKLENSDEIGIQNFAQ